MKTLTDLYNQAIVPMDAELEKQAAELVKQAEEEDAAGRIMARGFADELHKLAEGAAAQQGMGMAPSGSASFQRAMGPTPWGAQKAQRRPAGASMANPAGTKAPAPPMGGGGGGGAVAKQPKPPGQPKPA